jgi:hypothetical protein
VKGRRVYLIINGHGAGYRPQSWPFISNIRVVVKGPGGWEIELDVRTAVDWLWHCGLAQAEIKGWSFATNLQGGERVHLLANPRYGIEREVVRAHSRGYHTALVELRERDDEERSIQQRGLCERIELAGK